MKVADSPCQTGAARGSRVARILAYLALPLATWSCEPATIHPVGLDLADSCQLPAADRLELICPSAISLEVRDLDGTIVERACADVPSPPVLLSEMTQAIPRMELDDIERGVIALAIVSPGSEADGCPPPGQGNNVVAWGSTSFDLAMPQTPVITLDCASTAFEDPTCQGRCDDTHQDCKSALGDGCVARYNTCRIACGADSTCLDGCDAERDLCLENCDLDLDECKAACKACIAIR